MTKPYYMNEFSRKNTKDYLSNDGKYISVSVSIFKSVLGQPVRIELVSKVNNSSSECLGYISILNGSQPFTYEKSIGLPEETLSALKSMTEKELKDYYPSEWSELYEHLESFVEKVWCCVSNNPPLN